MNKKIDKLQSRASSERMKKYWKTRPPEERKARSEKMLKSKHEKMTQEEINAHAQKMRDAKALKNKGD